MIAITAPCVVDIAGSMVVVAIVRSILAGFGGGVGVGIGVGVGVGDGKTTGPPPPFAVPSLPQLHRKSARASALNPAALRGFAKQPIIWHPLMLVQKLCHLAGSGCLRFPNRQKLDGIIAPKSQKRQISCLNSIACAAGVAWQVCDGRVQEMQTSDGCPPMPARRRARCPTMPRSRARFAVPSLSCDE